MSEASTLPDQRIRRATFDAKPSTWNPTTRTIEVVAATETPVAERNASGRYYEVLNVEAASIVSTRLDGMAVLNNHRRGDLQDQLGVVVGHRIENRQLILVLRLSDRASVADIVGDIIGGVIRWVSISYNAIERKSRPAIDGVPALGVIRWEPVEVSFVSVAADPASKVRSKTMTDTVTAEPTESAEVTRTAPKPKPDYEAYLGMARAGKVSIDYMTRAIDEGLSPKEFGHRILTEQARRDMETQVSSVFVEDTRPNGEFNAQVEALAHRLNPSLPLSERARQFRGLSLARHAATIIERSPGGGRVRFTDDNEIVERALSFTNRGDLGGLHNTGDFATLLSASGNRALLAAYEAAPAPLKMIGVEKQARDFRALTTVIPPQHPTLREVLENDEIESVTMLSTKQTFSVKTYASIFGLTRQAIINDDLGAFSDFTQIQGRAAAETEAKLLANLWVSNPVMDDGVALFHASHANLGTAGAISSTTLAEAFLKMRTQKGPDGVTPINAVPRYLVCGPANEGPALQAVATITPATTATANIYAGRLEVIVDARITGNQWFVVAAPSQLACLAYAYLSSNKGPQFSSREGFRSLGVEFRVVLDFGAGILDHRGAVKNAGA